MLICGIDPGLTGAIARLDAKTGALIDVVDMPVFKLTKAGKNSKIVDAYLIADLLGRGCGHIFIEVQQTRPGQAAQAVLKCGVGYGIVLGVVAALGIPMTHVNPRAWKRALAVPAAKDGARARASELISGGAVHWPRVKDDGKAEAALIALWGWRSLGAIAAELNGDGMTTKPTTNSGVGPVASNTYSGISAELEAEERELARRKGLDVPPLLKPGEFPKLSGGSIWDADRDPVSPIDATDPDPSGTVLP